MAVTSIVVFVCTICFVSSQILQGGQEKDNIGKAGGKKYPVGKAEVICAMICDVGSTCSKTKIPWIEGFCDCRTDVVEVVGDVGEASAAPVMTKVPNCTAHKGYRLLTSVSMCVKFVTDYAIYPHGKATCEAEPGGRVVHLDTHEKIEAIGAIHKAEHGGRYFFIGLTHEPTYPLGDFRWTDGTPVGDTNWAPGEPANIDFKCVVTTYKNNWRDLNCFNESPIICEIESFLLN